LYHYETHFLLHGISFINILKNYYDENSVGANFTGLASKVMSRAGLGGRAVSLVGRAAGFIGMAITTAESWWMIYQSMDNLRFSPLSLDRATGEPYWGDPEYYFKSFEERW